MNLIKINVMLTLQRYRLCQLENLLYAYAKKQRGRSAGYLLIRTLLFAVLIVTLSKILQLHSLVCV